MSGIIEELDEIYEQERKDFNRSSREVNDIEWINRFANFTEADLDAARFLQDFILDDSTDISSVEGEIMRALGEDRKSNVTGRGSSKYQDVLYLCLHEATKREFNEGVVSLSGADQHFRRNKVDEAQSIFQEDYSNIQNVIGEFEGIQNSAHTSSEAAPLIDFAVETTGNTNFLDNLEWYGEDGFTSTQEDRELMRDYSQHVKNTVDEVFSIECNDEIYIFRGIGSVEEDIESAPLEYWSLNPYTASNFAPGDGNVIIDKISTEEIKVWSALSDQRYNIGEVVVARGNRNSEDLEVYDSEEFSNLKYIRETATKLVN
jgi:hypothetical protein